MRWRLALGAPVALALLWAAGCGAAEPPVGVPKGRLPDTVRPLAYRLKLEVDPSKTQFSGNTEIDARLNRPARSFFLHGLNLRVTRVEASAGGQWLAARYTQVDDTGVVRLDLPRELPAGPLTLRFEYSADFREAPEGLFHAKVGDHWHAWTQMEAIDARRMFPGFDEPGFKTPFSVTVAAPAELRVFANAPETGQEASGSLTVHHFAATRPLPTYLVAIAVGLFDVVNTYVPAAANGAQRGGPLPFGVIATRGQKARMQVAAVEGPKLLKLLEQYLELPYPFEKLDLAASPVQGGAMENAGLILFEDPLILLDEQARVGDLRNFGVTSAHEMSHQWLGDFVTPSWWTDIWLNESFAEWLGNKIAHQWRADLDVPVVQLAEALSAMDTDALGEGRPIHQEITDSRQISSAFDEITYLKGAQVLSMFESFMGEEKFRQGVRRHLQSHPYGNAVADDFFHALGDAAGDPRIAPAMRTFTDQTGVPVISVSESDSGVTLSQSRYHPLGVKEGGIKEGGVKEGGVKARGAQLWSIPVCLSRGEQRTCTLLQGAQGRLAPIPGDGPLVPNAGGSGYYRFRLDDAGWDRLIAASGSLPPREALAAADSLWSDFAAGSGRFARVIAGARALAAQPNSLPATHLAQPLRQLARTSLDANEQTGYRRLMGQIYGPRLAGLGLDVRRGVYAEESSARQSLRESLVPLVAVEAKDAQARTLLTRAAEASLGGDAAALDDAFRRVAFQVAVQEKGEAFMKPLKEAVQRSGDSLFRQDGVAALGAVDSAEGAALALQLAYAPGLRASETLALLSGLTARPGSRATAVNFIDAHFDQVVDAMPGFARPHLVGWLFGEECTQEAIGRADRWAQAHLKALGGGELELAQTKERIAVCASLRQAKAAEIAAVLGSASF